MVKHQSKPQVYKSDIASFSEVLTKRQQTSTKVLSFRKYINYNTPTCAISDL